MDGRIGHGSSNIIFTFLSKYSYKPHSHTCFMNNYEGEGVSAVLFNNEIDPNNPGHWRHHASVEEILNSRKNEI